MADGSKLPFQSFTFWIMRDLQPRTQFSLRAAPTVGEDGEGGKEGMAEFAAAYDLVIQQGATLNPSKMVRRMMPRETAEELRDALQDIGAFGWDESYDDAPGAPGLRWSLSVVFQEGVFTHTAKGGSATPPRFDELLEALYALDFPRPLAGGGGQHGVEGRGASDGGFGAASNSGSEPSAFGPSAPGSLDLSSMGGMLDGASGAMDSVGMGSMGGLSAGDLGAYHAVRGSKGDFSYLERMFRGGQTTTGAAGNATSPFADLEGFDPASIDPADVQHFFAEFQRNPRALQARLKEEYHALSSDQQARMLDALASLGYASRAWWERFFRN